MIILIFRMVNILHVPLRKDIDASVVFETGTTTTDNWTALQQCVHFFLLPKLNL